MSIFKSGRKTEKKQVRIFIVEDSKVYSHQLEFSLQSHFGDAVIVSCFPVAEVMDVKLEHQNFPDIIIMDHVLNDRYEDAESGLEALKRIKQGYPGIELVLHTASANDELIEKAVAENLFRFVPKGEKGLEELIKIVEGLRKF